jgi:multidrug efflux pump subunit AcrA (membrane-fusion protein)
MRVTLPGRPGPPGSAPPSSGASANGAHRRNRPIDRWRGTPRALRWGLIALGVLLVIVIVLVLVARQPPTASAPTEPAPTPVASRLIAHGIVQPVNQARVGTLGGGVLLGLSVAIGDRVEAQQELARVRGQADVEVLKAPFSGTVTGALAHTGDTLLPGAGVVLVADLSRLEVDTTDVDEFLVGHVHPGQTVTLEVEALDRREITARVATVALQPQTTPGGDQHYPVTIDLGGTPPDLRPGMSVRITLPA